MPARKLPMEHGTMRGYGKHYRQPDEHGPVCAECNEAYNHWRRAKYGHGTAYQYKVTRGVDSVKLRQQTLSAYKYNTPCADCHQYYEPVSMDLDHINPRRREIYGRSLARLPWPAFWEEMEKVEVVCSNCHRVRTASRQGKQLTGRADG